jgi:hypothetical protein
MRARSDLILKFFVMLRIWEGRDASPSHGAVCQRRNRAVQSTSRELDNAVFKWRQRSSEPAAGRPALPANQLRIRSVFVYSASVALARVVLWCEHE